MRIEIDKYRPNESFRIIRQGLGLTQKQLAEDLKISKSAIQKYEYGTLNYTFEIFYKMAKKYNLKITIERK